MQHVLRAITTSRTPNSCYQTTWRSVQGSTPGTEAIVSRGGTGTGRWTWTARAGGER